MRITISGVAGAGKTTIARALANRLKYRYFSGGDFWEELAKEKGITLLELQKLAATDPSIDGQTDEKIEKMSEEDDFVFEGRLSFHFVPNSLKVFLTCSPDVAAERILKDSSRTDEHYDTLEETKQAQAKRAETDRKRWQEKYGVDVTDQTQFDEVIDTSSIPAEEVVDLILELAK